MSDQRGKLTLKGIAEKKESAKRFLANGRYMTSDKARRGGIATVYRALDTNEERYIALKVFRQSGGVDDVVEESFRRETRALSDLKHPNIVQILDSGFDEETSEHYIAMEWVDQDLDALRATKPPANWAEFYGGVGRQILEALAFAHTHSTAHRDVKPSNILVTKDGVAKVCDFGISKLRNFLEPGVTLSQFASVPYAPPEHDDGNYTYSRDVFGFSALAVAVLARVPISNHPEMISALDKLGLEEPIRRLLRRCLSLDAPAERPQNAAVLLGEIDKAVPRAPSKKEGVVLMIPTRRVSDILKFDLGLDSEISVQKFIENDLGSAACEHEKGEPRQQPDGSEQVGRSVRIYGERYIYIAVPVPPEGHRLRLVTALEPSVADLERSRERAYRLPFKLSFDGTLPKVSGENISSLDEKLLQFAGDQKIQLLQHREQALYRTWLDLLSAKTELERKRKRRVPYEKVEPVGATVRLILPRGQDSQFLEEQDVQVEVSANDTFFGTVISVGDNVVVVQPTERNRVDIDKLPPSGSLVVDTTRADAALDKQRSAVDAVRYGRSVNPTLGSLIITPSSVATPTPVDVEFIQKNIDDDKKDAVRTALAEPPLMIVQGPPGTGKTTFITELVLQTLKKHQGARILLTSQTHVALDNSLERIARESAGQVEAVRIGHEDDDRIAATTKSLLVDSKLPVMRRSAIASGREFIEEWATKHGVDLSQTRMAMALERHASLRERLAYVEGHISELRPMLSEEKRKELEPEERADLDDQLAGLTKEQDALERDLKESLAVLRKYESDKETVDHLAECSAEELRTWANDYSPPTADGRVLRKLLAAHVDWETRFGRSREFKAALIASSQVVAGTCLGIMGIPGRNEITYDLCIVDEASIATPTEALVPMSRARRTVLVGDAKQLSPFQDPELKSSGLLERFQLRPEHQRMTLFNHLIDELDQGLKKTLTTQHRMLPAIGNLISGCFYKGELNSVPRELVAYLKGVVPKPVVWYSTSRRPNRSSRPVGTSHTNSLEVQFIVKLLGRIDFTMRHGKGKDKKVSVAVLTGYAEQKELLRDAVGTRQHEWASFSDVYVNVVDAFQGREADIVIFSVTRSDTGGLGFLREMERINVALSRGRELLVIVGDHIFCQEAEGRTNPLRDVLDYIRGNPQDCSLEEATP